VVVPLQVFQHAQFLVSIHHFLRLEREGFSCLAQLIFESPNPAPAPLCVSRPRCESEASGCRQLE
jgi:hypothetical protein